MRKQTPQKQAFLPTFGQIVPGEGGRLGGIMRGNLVDGQRQPNYALIVPNIDPVKMQWGSYGTSIPGAGSLTDGLVNTAAMLRADCASSAHVAGIRVDGHSDFYLASRAEFWALCANVPELFQKAIHWTSTQDDSHYACAQYFAHGNSGWGNKNNEYLIVPVRRIQLYHFNAQYCWGAEGDDE